MIDDTPFTKEEFSRFMIDVRERYEARRREQKIERACIAFAGVVCAIVAAIVFA